MKYRIRQYQSSVRKRFFENFYVFKKKFSKFRDRFMEKGHEKMTVMFIPHNEKKIFNFQISKFTILFFILLFMIVVATSSYAVISHNAVKKEEQRLLMSYEDIRSHLLRFEKATNNMTELVDEIKPEIEEVYELSAGSNDADQIWITDEIDQDELNELRKYRNVLPDEIYKIKDLQKDMICTTRTIKTVKNFIDVRSKVVQETPSIVPNEGHITSLFGWRRSPFGHGRDFHSGIDIAASSGTPIRATAPGSIASIGWGGGYGIMIRIKHKYGFETIYGHCRSAAVNAGTDVKKGDIVGYVGMTGNATGNHCHYEIRLGNIPINPYPYMSRIW
ncbi:MAG: M23 family metallopeptidase [Spirochaetes bacterium]|jgi:murein DD-endopeptidase MepM/ murein hydrolase activator NlpD|nr:M23 family metallopeptidase [Spirochaetota bacterium]